MADIDANISAEADMDKQSTKDKAKETIKQNRNSVGAAAGIGAAAALFGVGYMAGHKRAEKQSLYGKIMRQMK